MRYKCKLCGRDKFTSKQPHKCVGGFRKRKIIWEEITMSKQQTAVEWLTKEISSILGPLSTEPMQDLLLVDTINKAKTMERQQIIGAINSLNDTQRSNSIAFAAHKNEMSFAEQYYIDTFEISK